MHLLSSSKIIPATSNSFIFHSSPSSLQSRDSNDLLAAVPDLHNTCMKYLRSVKPLLTDEQVCQNPLQCKIHLNNDCRIFTCIQSCRRSTKLLLKDEQIRLSFFRCEHLAAVRLLIHRLQSILLQKAKSLMMDKKICTSPFHCENLAAVWFPSHHLHPVLSQKRQVPPDGQENLYQSISV